MSEIKAYDKAKWHYDAENFPSDLGKFQGFVHTGLFLGWLADRDLLDSNFAKEISSEIKALKSRKLTGPQLYKVLDGVFTSDRVAPEARPFVDWYYDSSGAFLDDYQDTIAEYFESLYEVKDTWKNFDLLAEEIDMRWNDWEKKSKAKPAAKGASKSNSKLKSKKKTKAKAKKR